MLRDYCRLVNYMMASGGDDGSLRIWDLRSFSSGSYVSNFQFHKSYITSVEWCPYEGSMLATSGGDDQLAVRLQHMQFSNVFHCSCKSADSASAVAMISRQCFEVAGRTFMPGLK